MEPGLLYPAMQKFYSALSNLDKFQKESNFFDNIACLDSFFSEYRNVTFVLQKSLAHTEYLELYNTYRDQYLADETSKWFVEKRNEVLKQQPFNLEKRILVTLFPSHAAVALKEQVFTVENDVGLSTIIDSLKAFLTHLNPVEVFFSVEYSFYEKGHDKDLFNDFIEGISNMKSFLAAMKDAIKQECKLCDQLEEKIERMTFNRISKDMLFVDDFVYYSQDDKFERASRVAIIIPDAPRMPISEFGQAWKRSDDNNNPFMDFVIMHIVIADMQKELLPTFMIIYEDDTWIFKTFGGSIKTTMYRTINELVKRMEPDGIKAIYYVGEFYGYADWKTVQNVNYHKRPKHATKESLCFFMLDKEIKV